MLFSPCPNIPREFHKGLLTCSLCCLFLSLTSAILPQCDLQISSSPGIWLPLTLPTPAHQELPSEVEGWGPDIRISCCHSNSKPGGSCSPPLYSSGHHRFIQGEKGSEKRDHTHSVPHPAQNRASWTHYPVCQGWGYTWREGRRPLSVSQVSNISR
jgi:hypothetical protein